MDAHDHETATPDHDPAVGDWYYHADAQELCCIVRIESWSPEVDETLGQMAMLVFEDGTLYDEPVSSIRDHPTYQRVERPRDPLPPREMADLIETVADGGDIETELVARGWLQSG